MTGQGLTIPQALYAQMVAHCKEKWPSEEACGYLVANADGALVKVYPMTNAEPTPVGYSMDPKQQLQIEKEMRANNQTLVGIYHSHTATEAYPSTVDINHAISPDVSYVIVSLKGQPPVVKSYRIDGATVTPEQLFTV